MNYKNVTEELSENLFFPIDIIYRIYAIKEEEDERKEEDDSKLVDRCHGCLRLLFAVSFFIIIFSTAFISRFTFHLLLINLNPPTSFTSLNKFGGDVVNTTVPFKPAEVHTSWIWACFLVIITPTIHQLLYHCKQKCFKDEKTVKKTDEKDFYINIKCLSRPTRVAPKESSNSFIKENGSNTESNQRESKPSTSKADTSVGSDENQAAAGRYTKRKRQEVSLMMLGYTTMRVVLLV